MARSRTTLSLPLSLVVLGLAACGGADTADRPPQADSGFSTEGPDDAGAFYDEDDDAGDGAEGEPDPPESDLCDAGNEAWVKRAIPFIQGRRPDSIREVRTLVSAIEQLDASSRDGRRLVAVALAQGPLYRERWKTYLYENLRVQRTGDRLNTLCYNRRTDASLDETLAATVRDGSADEDVLLAGSPPTAPTIADLAYSALFLDDVSPLYRADLFARMWAPLIGGNVDREELEVANRALFGSLFESVYLGRNTECLQCHITTHATTLTTDANTNRHWSVYPEIDVEYAVYGTFTFGEETQDLEDVHAIFRHAGFVDYSWCQDAAGGCNPAGLAAATGIAPWGMSVNCGIFRDDHFDDPLVGLESAVPYMAGSYSQGNDANIFDLEQRFRRGLDSLAESGLTASGDGEFLEADDPEAAMAFLFSLNFAEGVWKEAMGYPLTVANKFPRNTAQRDTLQHLAETFFSSHYSLRELMVEVAVGEYFSQAPPDTCGAGTAYGMPALFDPFSKESANVDERGNGVGDMVHRYSAAVLLDSVSQAMWWTRFNRFGVQTMGGYVGAFLDAPLDTAGVNANVVHIDLETGQNLACCGGGECPQSCTDAPNNVDFLRDIGLHISQLAPGFSGTDFNGLLHWEEEYAAGNDPALGNPAVECTGPLGGTCTNTDYVSALINTAGASTMRDIAIALKDRLITEPLIAGEAEVAAIEAVMGESLDTPVGSADDAEASARRYVGVLLNSPQFVLDGVPSRDQPVSADPVLIVPGTDTTASCNYFAEMAGLSDEWTGLSVTCGPAGITVN
ncbi:MAG: hypothetical protein JKY37_10545 [Nannocystaceae bacterium]|nr:hypothetical protein [Nannocystaceae bacterium]